MSLFDRYIMVDWTGGNQSGLRPQKDALWAAVFEDQVLADPVYFRHRGAIETWLTDQIARAIADDARLCVGFDFAFGYPKGFARAVTGQDDPLVLWDWFEDQIEDTPGVNNRFDLAGDINGLLDGIGPFWGNGLARDIDHLPRKGNDRTNADFAEKRVVETHAKGAFTCWQMSGAGAVGGQVFTGLPILSRLRTQFPQVAVWPFQPLDRAVAFVEIWPSLLNDAVNDSLKAARFEPIKDAHQVAVCAQAVAGMDRDGSLADALAQGAAGGAEGWILGVGAEKALRAGASRRLPNDCFALPPGVDWVPVDEALGRLDASLRTVCIPEICTLNDAADRIVAAPIHALRDNPPMPNSAVDGYGFAHDSAGAQMPLAQGRAAAGAAFDNALPKGQALRILTGAALPRGVDTVVLQEDCNVADGILQIGHVPKPGANTRKAGEDVAKGTTLFTQGRRLTPPDLALLAATGHGEVSVFERLRVGVLSTGDELVSPGNQADPHQTYDANRPMLLSLLTRWGHIAVDLGHAPDDRDVLRAKLEQAAQSCDAIVTSGGASAGDEDHVSAILRSEGTLSSWRIALKPGRPLVLAQWNGVPVFGLPGNPVAAFVCALIFARPALSKLAGGTFDAPQAFQVPAAFTKTKKPGRVEFLRARVRDGGAQVFASEGSGRISGLSWADGLVRLPHGAAQINEGDPVDFLPYGSFGL